MPEPDFDQIDGRDSVIPWSRWYADARSEMAFRYGLRLIPKDAYKTEFALGSTATQAVRNIFQHMNTIGDKRLWR